GRLTVQGGVALADLEAEIEHDFERDDVATVGGLVLAEFGRVPRAGESVTVDEWQITVEVITRRRIRRVVVTPPVRAMSPDREEEE
ncbi:MAG TPA: transporter associated domain-containing protein, partial [Gemmatimonadales bacterium]|nr:transporter associated domain-containing protein [Gemmatimonadales bacterium]